MESESNLCEIKSEAIQESDQSCEKEDSSEISKSSSSENTNNEIELENASPDPKIIHKRKAENDDLDHENNDSHHETKEEMKINENLKKTKVSQMQAIIPEGYVFGAKMKTPKATPEPKTPLKLSDLKPFDASKSIGFSNNINSLFSTIGESSKFKEKEMRDGEENDTVVVDTSATMFTFDSKEKAWKKIGGVSVHLNDCSNNDGKYSRIILRLKDTHRLLVNSRISKSTMVEMVDPTKLRITVDDVEQQVQKIVCLKLANSSTLFDAINARKI